MSNSHFLSLLKQDISCAINEAELIYSFIRSPGPGGQNVNKVATAVQLRFNVLHSPSLPESVRVPSESRVRLLSQASNKISQQGDLIIKATRHRTQQANKQDALQRLRDILCKAATIPKKRKPTKPTFASKQRRLSHKKLHGTMKATRSKKITKDE